MALCDSALRWLPGAKYTFEAKLTQRTKVYRHKNLNVGVLRGKQSCRYDLHWQEVLQHSSSQKQLLVGPACVTNLRFVHGGNTFVPLPSAVVCL